MSEVRAGSSKSELLPCPYCSAEPEILNDGRRTWGLVQHNDGCLFPTYPKHEIPESDFAAWNSRAPIEYEGWFYLPKPKEGIVDYGEPEMTRTENGYKVRQIVDVVDEAARKWGEELGEYTMRRICEIWNNRAERTCHIEWRDDSYDTDAGYERDGAYFCTACRAELPYPFQECWDDYQAGNCEKPFNYCPNCGRKCI